MGPYYAVLGSLWGLSAAARYDSGNKDDKEKGELLTETKAYKKDTANKKDNADQKD